MKIHAPDNMPLRVLPQGVICEEPCLFGSLPEGNGALTLRGMNAAHVRPIHKVRWENFRRLLARQELTITAAADLLGKTQGQVSHFGGAKPSKVIGDQVAAEIEEVFGLRAGYMDLNHSVREERMSGAGSNEAGTGLASQIALPAPSIVATAEKWLRFEEGVYKKSGLQAWGPDPEARLVRRAERLIALIGLLQARGGALSPEEAAQHIDAVRQQVGEAKHGRKSARESPAGLGRGA